MARHEVTVRATWEGDTTFEFDTAEEAEAFREKVSGGGQEGLEAIVEAGDIFSNNTELTDWEAC